MLVASPEEREGRHAFAGYIGPRTLVGIIENTAPYLLNTSHRTCDQSLAELAPGRMGWRRILQHSGMLEATQEPTPAQRTDYFALCLAAHFATVATYIPTDVDSKIRDHLWREQKDVAELRRMATITLQAAEWNVGQVSNRLIDADSQGMVSGHDGERLSVMAAGMLALTRAGDLEMAACLEDSIDAELRREVSVFERFAATRGREVQLLCLAAILTHNAGDLDQGLAARLGKATAIVPKLRFGRLCHERLQRYDGTFARAAKVYKDIMAAEGHRNYPLRELKMLRRDPALLLPISPFLDDWGGLLSRYKRWDLSERAEVMATLVWAAMKLKNQVGYFRALAGFDASYPRGLAAPELMEFYPARVRKMLRDAHLRRSIHVSRASFESSLGTRARNILATYH